MYADPCILSSTLKVGTSPRCPATVRLKRPCPDGPSPLSSLVQPSSCPPVQSLKPFYLWLPCRREGLCGTRLALPNCVVTVKAPLAQTAPQACLQHCALSPSSPMARTLSSTLSQTSLMRAYLDWRKITTTSPWYHFLACEPQCACLKAAVLHPVQSDVSCGPCTTPHHTPHHTTPHHTTPHQIMPDSQTSVHACGLLSHTSNSTLSFSASQARKGLLPQPLSQPGSPYRKNLAITCVLSRFHSLNLLFMYGHPQLWCARSLPLCAAHFLPAVVLAYSHSLQ